MSTSSSLQLKIGLDGISCLDFTVFNGVTFLAVGTCSGRVWIYNYSDETKPVVRKRWHKTIRCLSFFHESPNHVISASKQSGLKLHDIETQQRLWTHLNAHDRSPISSLLVLDHSRWVTGDENGIIKIWDSRQQDVVATLKPQGDEATFDDQFCAINDLAISSNTHGMLLAAVDDGSLATYNLRRRRFEMVSETLGYSARSLAVVKNDRKVLVGTDEGVISVFNWNEFGNICDRFPVHSLIPSKSGNVRGVTSGAHSVEKIVKITEDVVGVATDDGVISAINILPNRLLGSIGMHRDDSLMDGADCLTMALSPTDLRIASACPTSKRVCFWSTASHVERGEAEEADLRLPRKFRRLESTKVKGVNARKSMLRTSASRAEYLSGLMPETSTADNNGGASDEDSDDDDDDDSD